MWTPQAGKSPQLFLTCRNGCTLIAKTAKNASNVQLKSDVDDSMDLETTNRHRRLAKRQASRLAVPGDSCVGLVGVPSSPPPTACLANLKKSSSGSWRGTY